MTEKELQEREQFFLQECLSERKPLVFPAQQQTIHYTELPENNDSPIATEWNLYRREAGRLLAEGHEGRWVLLKGEQIIGIWDTEVEARAVAVERYLMQPVLIHQILTREPVLRTPTFLSRCRN